MKDFKFQNGAKIIFGESSLSYLKEELLKFNVKKMLILSSGDFIKDLGIYDEIINVCENLNISYFYENKVVPNPKLELARELINLCKKENIDFILAVGGGSSVDTAKAVAVGAKSDIDVWDFYLYKSEPTKALPIGVISTIASSGSETSNASILSSDENKLGIEYDFLIPKFAILNPLYLESVPKFQMFAGITDISAHLLERYFTSVKFVDTTDYMIEGMLKSLFLNVERLLKDNKNRNALSEIFFISVIAHNNLLDCGRISDWASHRIEHELSQEYGITHGEGMATVLPAYIRYMADKAPEKLAQLANRLFGYDYKNYSEKELALLLADKLEQIYISIGMRTKLSNFNIKDDKFTKMAIKATKNDKMKIGHYTGLSLSEVIEVLKFAL
ncbi:iron-containing alcohol dehydrogenase [Caviibacter abscessus]|uniref:iron-containing alcohol dehydrogenase n=1 Tax=Caviibacter abscessus TaxID=1766719 RepID=UPI00082AD87A|nr:iron-containing alcohol dehydrogenase [Caviibacter abscessus]